MDHIPSFSLPPQLTWKALRFVKGRHNAKTLAFVKSVYAYVAITTPAIDDPFHRMRIYQDAGMAALHNQVRWRGCRSHCAMAGRACSLPLSRSVWRKATCYCGAWCKRSLSYPYPWLWQHH